MTSAHLRAVRLLVVGLGLAAIGCFRSQVQRPAVAYYLDAQALPGRVHRAVLIPLGNETQYPTAEDGMTAALYQAIQGRRLFHVDVSATSDPTLEGVPMDGRRPFSLKELARLRQSLGCDAVLVGAMRQFRPHPHIQVGLYLRLLDLRDSRVIWAVDHVWDATDQATQKRVEAYFRTQKGSGYDPVQWELTMLSPAAFEEFVAYEVARTLPEGGGGR